jgi:tRNA (mo5U34)-methyltransferase
MVPGLQFRFDGSDQAVRVNRFLDSLRAQSPQDAWLAVVCGLAEEKLEGHPHGDLPRWRAALARLPATRPAAILDSPVPELGTQAPDPDALREILMELHPWRKGPLRLGGLHIETEWRSDWKWQRLAPHVNLKGQRVLDIGSGNGYFGMRMLGAGARYVVGIDPTLVFVMQWLACRHFSGEIPNYVLPLGIEDLPDTAAEWDSVFSMGVLYHRKTPQNHLERIFSLLKKGGTLVLETLVLPKGSEECLLVPGDRYARMRNVWGIPGTDRLLEWVNEAGFSLAKVVDMTPTTTLEQRSTDWMRFESLEQALDPQDRTLTIEGFPAPARAIVVARK